MKGKDAEKGEGKALENGGLKRKEDQLKKILQTFDSALIAFSGGVDSSYLLHKARECLGENLLAVTAAFEVYLEDELEEACRIAREIGAKHLIVRARMLTKSKFAANPPSRCYYCKRELFHIFKQIASRKKLAVVCDGTNADDPKEFRPGFQAAVELQVRSPLLEAGLTKKEIRLLSKRAGLGTWDLPASPCLATRLPYGEKITIEKLEMVAAAEKFLQSLGHTILRVRCHWRMARIEVPPEEIPILFQKRKTIVKHLQALGFTYVTLDLQGFRSGSMNETQF